MRYYCARQRTSDGRWDYCCGDRPTGYCGAFVPLEVNQYGATQEFVDQNNATKHKHHTDGHETEQEACDCYKEYTLDHRLQFREDRLDDSEQRRCEVCDAWTSGYATIGSYRIMTLCAEHRTREVVGERLSVGESWES